MLGAIVTVAFLAGTITTGTVVSTAVHREAPLLGTDWHSILDKINEVKNEINNVIQPEIIQLRTDINTNATILDNFIDNDAVVLRDNIDDNKELIIALEERIISLEKLHTVP